MAIGGGNPFKRIREYGGGRPSNIQGSTFKLVKIGVGPSPDERVQRLLARLKALREIPGEDREADIRWGQASQFDYTTDRREQPRVTIHFPPDEPPDDEEPSIPMTEISKSVEEIRVENPDDAEQYVIVERRIWSLFENGEDGRTYRFTYLND